MGDVHEQSSSGIITRDAGCQAEHTYSKDAGNVAVVITKGPGKVAGLKSHFQRVAWGLRPVRECCMCTDAQGRPSEDTTWKQRPVRGVCRRSCRGNSKRRGPGRNEDGVVGAGSLGGQVLETREATGA